ncbi:MAG: hypothetical protein PUG37_02945 [Bacillales bacterium]|nr:hypothetical protein [Bacillales bacterium]MDY6141635.1 hypothetical protein [Bacilli bacterium]
MKKIIKASLLLVLPFIAVSCGNEGKTSSSVPPSVTITTTENVTTTTENIPPTDVNSESTSSGPTDVGNLPFI